MGSSRSKFNARKVRRGGMEFDSQKEYRRFCELSLLERAGKITGLERQVKFELIPKQTERYERISKKTGKRLSDGIRTLELPTNYIADFVYLQDGNRIVEDVKGCRTGAAYELFSVKRKLMLFVHGIRVQEI